VAVELKAGPFKTAYLGQLSGYLSMLDGFVRKEHENPSIGIVLCKDMNKVFVNYAGRDYEKPMGVATYKTSKDMPHAATIQEPTLSGVAIREGVFKSLQTTEQHFFEWYGKRIDFFVYDSNNLTELDRYSESSDICAMIINMQAFNTSMKEGANNKQARIIFDERDEFGSRRPIDVIAANRPIIIQDEPQKMGGKATQTGIKRFNPLFCLNYSATHRVKYNTAHAQ
jgi:hypothetical protein